MIASVGIASVSKRNISIQYKIQSRRIGVIAY